MISYDHIRLVDNFNDYIILYWRLTWPVDPVREPLGVVHEDVHDDDQRAGLRSTFLRQRCRQKSVLPWDDLRPVHTMLHFPGYHSGQLAGKHINSDVSLSLSLCFCPSLCLCLSLCFCPLSLYRSLPPSLYVSPYICLACSLSLSLSVSSPLSLYLSLYRSLALFLSTYLSLFLPLSTKLKSILYENKTLLLSIGRLWRDDRKPAEILLKWTAYSYHFEVTVWVYLRQV